MWNSISVVDIRISPSARFSFREQREQKAEKSAKVQGQKAQVMEKTRAGAIIEASKVRGEFAIIDGWTAGVRRGEN
jgi:hypothetical protein